MLFAAKDLILDHNEELKREQLTKNNKKQKKIKKNKTRWMKIRFSRTSKSKIEKYAREKVLEDRNCFKSKRKRI
jgi:hypothetical protein